MRCVRARARAPINNGDNSHVSTSRRSARARAVITFANGGRAMTSSRMGAAVTVNRMHRHAISRRIVSGTDYARLRACFLFPCAIDPRGLGEARFCVGP